MYEENENWTNGWRVAAAATSATAPLTTTAAPTTATAPYTTTKSTVHGQSATTGTYIVDRKSIAR